MSIAEKVSAKVYPLPSDNNAFKNQFHAMDYAKKVRGQRQKFERGYTTALGHAFEFMEWASYEDYELWNGKWDNGKHKAMTTPELYDYWFNNIKSKEK
jgi:hypothetical protein